MGLKGMQLLFQSKRSVLTCTYKCGNACAGECTNTSNNKYFGDLVSRRGVLKGFGLGVVTVGGGATLAACATDENETQLRQLALLLLLVLLENRLNLRLVCSLKR